MRLGKLLAQFKWVAKSRIATDDDRVSTWFLWATHVLQDLHHIKRRIGFPPPSEIVDWKTLRALIDRARKPRAALKPAERALLIDYGDWKLEQIRLEAENAALLCALLQAAAIFASTHANPENVQTAEIYRYIATEFGVLPPPVGALPRDDEPWVIDRRATMRLCDKLMREELTIPSWMLHGKPPTKDDVPPQEGTPGASAED